MKKTLYEKLKEKKYTEYTMCQLPGCKNKLVLLSGQKIRKYCCVEHAKEAQKMYLKEWRKNNQSLVKFYNKRYSRNRKRKIKQGLIIPKKYENKKTKVN